MSRVLVVEDEAHLAQGLRFNLQAEGHAVEVAGDAETALDRLVEKQERFDAIVLDVMLPGKSGFDVAALLREKKNYVPILMLTARGRPEDVLQGFAAGADDYLPKPFELAILIARLESLLRRSVWMKDAVVARDRSDAGQANSQPAPLAGREVGQPEAIDTFSFAGKTIDFGELELRSLGNTIHLTVMEAEFLRYLVQIAVALFRAKRSSKTSGVCTRIPTPAPSIISSYACAATSKAIRPSPSIC